MFRKVACNILELIPNNAGMSRKGVEFKWNFIARTTIYINTWAFDLYLLGKVLAYLALPTIEDY